MASTLTHELPPILRGTEQQQLTDIRDYLVRLAQSLNTLENATVISSSASEKVTKKVTEDIKQQATDLRSLIIKTADALNVRIESNSSEIDDINGTISTLGNIYVAQSAFGTYSQSVQSSIQNLAYGVEELYNSVESITVHNTEQDGLMDKYLTLVNGEIRRGFVNDPDNPGQKIIGIAISQSLVFASGTHEDPPDSGIIYYEIDSSLAQTFGLYTSKGWQFWVNGRKVGWFDSTDADGALHVASEIIENSLRFGEDWIIDQNSNGIGLRYIGS